MANTNLLTELSDQMAATVEHVAPSVLQVRSRRWRAAAGLAFSTDHVLVSAHAIEQEENLSVVLNGRTVAARLAGHDPSTDLAVLEAPDLHATPIGPSAAAVRVGQLTVAVGRSWSGGVVAGLTVISSVGGPWRSGRGPAVETVFRTNLTPYAGFTGGALVAADGSLVGIISGILLRGLSLAIPAPTAWQVADMLVKHGRIRRAFLGVGGQPVRLPEAQRTGGHERGVLLVSISDGSPAQQAGLLIGDVLLSFNGRVSEDPEALLSLLTGDLIGRKTAIEILRGGLVKTIDVTLAER